MTKHRILLFIGTYSMIFSTNNFDQNNFITQKICKYLTRVDTSSFGSTSTYTKELPKQNFPHIYSFKDKSAADNPEFRKYFLERMSDKKEDDLIGQWFSRLVVKSATSQYNDNLCLHMNIFENITKLLSNKDNREADYRFIAIGIIFANYIKFTKLIDHEYAAIQSLYHDIMQNESRERVEYTRATMLDYISREEYNKFLYSLHPDVSSLTTELQNNLLNQ